MMRLLALWSFFIFSLVQTSSAQTGGNNLEMRLMLVNATLELNQAMLEGVQASIDTLNLPENTRVLKENDMKATLLRMKRARDKVLLMPYLLHVQDSLTTEITLLTQEKSALETMLKRAQQAEPIVVNSKTITAGTDTLQLETNYHPSTGKKETIITNKHTKEVIVMNDDMRQSERKKNEKKLKKYRDVLPLDTVLVFDMASDLTPEPERKSQTTKNYASKPIDSAEVNRIKNDTSSIIVIRNPESNDSIVIKPSKKKTVREKIETTADSTAFIKAEFFYKRAQRSIGENDTKKAVEYLEKAVELNPNYALVWRALAELDEQRGNNAKALKEYEHSAAADSSQYVVFYKIGLIYMKSNRKEEAFRNFDRAVQLAPAYVEARMERAAIYVSWNQLENAIKDYDQITRIDKTYYKAYKARGMAKMNYKQYDAAADDFTRFLIFMPDDAESYYYRGVCRIGNHELLDGCLDLSTAAEKGYGAAEKAIRSSCE